MYLIKTQGTAKIPDYVQVRDDNFALLEHIILNKIDNFINESEFLNKEEVKELIANTPFGKIIKIN